jgi:hypothetical protein
MHSHECEPSLGSTSTINQEAWAFGLSDDREQGTTRNFTRKSKPPTIRAQATCGGPMVAKLIWRASRLSS